ncbi:hypothetical protein CS8_059590 [Cupriavidus sp. 8B]
MLQMKQRRRIYYTESQRALMWERWQKGESLQHIAQLFDRNHSSVKRILAETGGIQPAQRHCSRLALTLPEREEISRSMVAGLSIRSIAARHGRAPSTISRELARNGGGQGYRANRADQLAWQRARRPKVCKRFTVATDIKVYFCDPQHPWQRGSNENTNGLLRQYFSA